MSDAEEEEWDPRVWSRSKRECPYCGDWIGYTEELFLLQVCSARMTEGQLDWGPMMADNGVHFRYLPHLFHFKCWETILDDVRQMTEDVPPHDAKDPVMICTVCSSLIGAEEAFITVTYTELQVSRRCPSGTITDALEHMGTPEPICLECVSNVVEEHFPAWEDIFYDMPEGYLDDERPEDRFSEG